MIKTAFLTVLILFTFLLVSAQDSIYYYGGDYRQVTGFSEARFMERIHTRSPKVHIIKYFKREDDTWKPQPRRKVKTVKKGEQVITISNKLLDPEIIHRYYQEVSPGLYSFREYQRDDLIREGSATRLVPLLLEDTVKEYYKTGQIRTLALYHNNQMLGNQNWLRDGSAYIDNIFYAADDVPEYSKGNGYFSQYILAGLKKSGMDLTQYSDKIILGWVITEKGELTGVHVVYGKSIELNRFMVKLVATLPGEWVPAILNGKKVRYYMTIPFNFGEPTRYFDNLQLNNIGQLDWN